MRVRIGGRAASLALVMAAGCAGSSLGNANGTLSVEPRLDFGAVILGHRPTLSVHLRNTSRSTIRLGEIHFQQPGSETFSLPESAPQTLPPGGQASLVIGFAPVEPGPRATRLVIPSASTGGPTWNVDVAGLGVLGQVDVQPAAINFGDVGLGTTSTRQVTLSNTADTPAEVLISAISGDDAPFFSLSQSGTLPVEGHRQIELTVGFSPNRMGPFVASLAVLPCPTCALQAIPIQGNGVAAAFVVNPPAVNFGHLPLGGHGARQVTVTNVGTRTAQIVSVQLGNSTSPAFTLQPVTPNVALTPGGSMQVEVDYDPVTNATNAGTLRISTDDLSSPMLVVGLSGGGDGPALAVIPSTVNFGATALGVSVQKTVTLRNVGTDPTGTQPLQITGLTLTHGVQFSVSSGAATGFPISLTPGQSWIATVTYTPLIAGDAEGTLEVDSNDPANDAVTVPLLGSAQELGECTYAVTPGQLDFGTVSPMAEATLAISIRNVGANPCAFANVMLAPASDAAFSVAPVAGGILDPGGQLVVPVTFAPLSEASFTGLVQFDASSHTAPQGRVLLTGAGATTCLTVLPQMLDYGTVGLQCREPTRSAILRNDCSVPTDIQQVWIGTTQSTAFSLAAGQDTPSTLAPGAQRQLDVTYAPTIAGLDAAPLYVSSSESPSPHLIALKGGAEDQPLKTDTFTGGTTNKVDVLFVVDNSGSMSDKQQNLAANAADFMARALRQNADFHFGITTTGMYPYDGGWGVCPGGAGGGEAGRLFPVDNSQPRIITNTTPNAAAAFASNFQVGICHWWEEGLEAMRLALSTPLVDHLDDPTTAPSNDGNLGFLRSDAKLAIFFVTDADDSDSTDVSQYIDMLHALKPGRPDLVSASGAIGLSSCNHIESVGNRYMELINGMGGRIYDVCATDWGTTLGQVADDAFTPSSSFPLSQATTDPAGISVVVNGVPIAPQNGSLTIWHYDPASGAHGAVVFDQTQGPRSGATVEVTYPVPCP